MVNKKNLPQSFQNDRLISTALFYLVQLHSEGLPKAGKLPCRSHYTDINEPVVALSLNNQRQARGLNFLLQSLSFQLDHQKQFDFHRFTFGMKNAYMHLIIGVLHHTPEYFIVKMATSISVGGNQSEPGGHTFIRILLVDHHVYMYGQRI